VIALFNHLVRNTRIDAVGGSVESAELDLLSILNHARVTVFPSDGNLDILFSVHEQIERASLFKERQERNTRTKQRENKKRNTLVLSNLPEICLMIAAMEARISLTVLGTGASGAPSSPTAALSVSTLKTHRSRLSPVSTRAITITSCCNEP
jgi:hypothetical protein